MAHVDRSSANVANTDGELGRTITDEAGCPLVAAIEIIAQSEGDGVPVGDAEDERRIKGGGCQVEMETRKNPDLPTQAELMYPTPTATYGSNSGGERP